MRTQKKLLVIDNLTLAKAVEVAQGDEAADQNAEALKGKETTLNVTTPCYRCGELPTTKTTVGSAGHHVGTVENWDIICQSKKKVEP